MLQGHTQVTRRISDSLSSFSRSYSLFRIPLKSLPFLQHRPSFSRTRFRTVLNQRKPFYSQSNVQKPQREAENEEAPKPQKRKNQRSPAGKNSLRRVAVEAQRSRDGKEARRSSGGEPPASTKTVTAYCAAEQYDVSHVASILRDAGYNLDPYETSLYPQVIHIEVLNNSPSHRAGSPTPSTGDVFIFPSGTVVAWDVPESTSNFLVTRTLLPAAQQPHLSQLESEDLEYTEDATRE
ncbi:MAG: hypothetical protein Q9170_006631, partial [Blastenia crenularia]